MSVWWFVGGMVVGAVLTIVVETWEEYWEDRSRSQSPEGPSTPSARHEHDTFPGELGGPTRHATVEPRCTCTWISTATQAPTRILSTSCPIHGTHGIGRGPRHIPEDPEHDD